MHCYLCGTSIPDGDPFYNDHGQQVCKPCFLAAPRCYVCRFPGRAMQLVEGLGGECEFCRGNLVAEGMELGPMLQPLRGFLAHFEVAAPTGAAGEPVFRWTDRLQLRHMQTSEDLPPDAFMDDFLRYCYPVYYKRGEFFLLKRMTKPTFVVHALIQLAAAHLAREFGLESLAGRSPFHTYVRGWCHWVGYEAAGLLKYELEQRQLKKWPELGAQGEFSRWEALARTTPAPKVNASFRANLGALAKRHLAPPPQPAAP